MNNDSLIEQMRVVVFARSAPGKALNTLSCEAIIVVRFGDIFLCVPHVGIDFVKPLVF